MTRTRGFVGCALAGCLVFLGTGVGRAQVRVEGKRVTEDKRVVEGARAEGPRRARDILGSKVYIRGEHAVGTVDDIIFNNDGSIEYLSVLDHGKYVLVPWEAVKFNYGRRMATVEITPERFRTIPTYTRESFPNVYETRTRERIYGYYGLKPRAERRIERREGRRP